MKQITSSDLGDRIADALTDSKSELWFPQLTYDLAQIGWRKLEETTKLDASNYGTLRVMLNNADAEREIAYTLLFKNQGNKIEDMISVELLPASLTDRYKESEVDFYTLKNLTSKEHMRNEILDCLICAFNVIRAVPSLFETVVQLVKCVHLIKPESDEYDVSFSEPDIPFSIYVSVPQKNNPINALRVAEAIVHEAMHLQLTLVESISQLVTSSPEKFYSPWKAENRTADGVLHALYVFQVLRSFFLKLFNCHLLSSKERHFLDERRILIANQISDIEDFVNCASLTSLGKALTHRLFTYTF